MADEILGKNKIEKIQKQLNKKFAPQSQEYKANLSILLEK